MRDGLRKIQQFPLLFQCSADDPALSTAMTCPDDDVRCTIEELPPDPINTPTLGTEDAPFVVARAYVTYSNVTTRTLVQPRPTYLTPYFADVHSKAIATDTITPLYCVSVENNWPSDGHCAPVLLPFDVPKTAFDVVQSLHADHRHNLLQFTGLKESNCIFLVKFIGRVAGTHDLFVVKVVDATKYITHISKSTGRSLKNPRKQYPTGWKERGRVGTIRFGACSTNRTHHVCRYQPYKHMITTTSTKPRHIAFPIT
jgi:hypothetical protein